MTVPDILQRLQSIAQPRARAIWTDFGMESPDVYYGVQLTQLKEVAKAIKKSHDLALALWQTGIHDAKLLSTMIEEPKKVMPDQIDKQIMEVYTPDLVDKYCSNVIAKTVFREDKAVEWMKSPEEMIKRAGFQLLVAQAKDADLPDTYFEKHLRHIRKELQKERNWVKEAMNYALITIGSRNAALNTQAIEVAQAIGKVYIDYGKTSCKNPDPLTSLTGKRVRATLIA